MIRIFGAFIALAIPALAHAQALEVQAVTNNIWAIVGEKEQRSPENLANNATEQGAVLVDPGRSWKGAKALQAAIRTVTDQPVRYAINTGGQDHRWLGNGHWLAQGATVIAAPQQWSARGYLRLSDAPA